MAVNNGVYGGFASVNLRKPDLMQDDPRKGDFVKGKEEFLAQAGAGSGQNVPQVEPAYGDRPLVFFGAPLQQTKTEIVCKMWYYSQTLKFTCYAKIKAQGNSTMKWPKKNQSVKLYKDEACTEKLKINFKGWGKQYKFVIKANWRDLTHVRDVGSVRLEAECAKSRENYDTMPELLRTSPNMGAVDGFPVVVYAAGVYQGRYMWNIPKDAWMANMDDELDTHCILCSEDFNSGCFRAAAKINGSDWTDEIHDTVPESIKNRWNEVISFVQNATDEEFAANLDSYIDVESLIDRHLMGLYSCDFDGYGKNQVYMTYDGQKWYAVPYDKDGTWGVYWSGNSMLPSDYPRKSYEDFTSTDSDGEGNLLFIRLEQVFWQRMQDRWAFLRDTTLSVANTIARVRELSDITPPYIVAEDYASTTAGGAFASIPNKTTCTIPQIQQFAAERHEWTDAYVAGLTPEVKVPCTGIELDKSEMSFTAAGTQNLTATVEPENTTDPVVWSSDTPSVATVVGGVVTAVANGSAVITARCGEHSASCAVAVSGIAEPVPCTGISLSANTLTFSAPGTQTLIATVEPTDCTDAITWESDNTGVATVDGGVVAAVADGYATITVRCGAYSARCTVTVSGMADASVDLTWTSGYSYNATTGAWEEVANEVASNKVQLENRKYTFAKDSGSYPAVFVWDENGVYIGRIENLSGVFWANPNYTYAFKVFNGVNPRVVRNAPSSDPVPRTEIVLADLEWKAETWTNSRGYHVSSSLSDVFGVGTAYIDRTNNFGGELVFAAPGGIKFELAAGRTDAIASFYPDQPSLKYYRWGADTAAAKAFFEENGTKLVVND